MTDLRISDSSNSYLNSAFLSSCENNEKIDANEAVQSSSQERDNDVKGTETPSPKYPFPSGLKNWDEWEKLLKEYFSSPIELAIFKKMIKDSLDKGEPLPYDKIISELERYNHPIFKDRSKEKLNNIINAFKGEKAAWEKFAKEEVNKKIDRLKELIQILEAYLMRSLSPDDLQKIKDMIDLLKEKLPILEDISKSKLSPPEIMKKLQENAGSINDLIRNVNKLREALLSNPKYADKDTSPILPPNHDIPLEDGETVRNQKPKGYGIGRASGASNYLKAFFAFSQTCNKLITMNAAWGIQLGELQKAATQLSLSGQATLNKLIKKEVDNFNGDNSPHRISELQSWISQLQNDFGAYQKSLDTVMPLILEQPKNITKDLDKFLEAAKSILQLVTAYANFRI